MDYYFKCIDCGAEYQPDKIHYLCPACEANQKADEFQKGVLSTILNPHDLKVLRLKPFISATDFFIFPFHDYYSFPAGNTALMTPSRLREKLGFKNLFFKNDFQNPSGSLKDRASLLVAAQADYYNEKTVVLASTGNAGAAMACAGAALGLDVILFVPETAPRTKLLQSVLYGARVVPVKANYDQAFKISIEYTKKYGGINRNTAYNPITIEGKKSVATELYNQFHEEVPDYIIVPVGDGVIYSGVYKGFHDLKEAGLINYIPRIIGVQAQKSNAISRAWKTGSFKKLDTTGTIADSISVESPANGRMTVKYINECDGWVTEVNDEEILAAQLELGKEAGVFVEPASASAWAGFLKDQKRFEPEASVVILLTGTGLKDTRAIEPKIQFPESVEPNLDKIKEHLDQKQN